MDKSQKKELAKEIAEEISLDDNYDPSSGGEMDELICIEYLFSNSYKYIYENGYISVVDNRNFCCSIYNKNKFWNEFREHCQKYDVDFIYINKDYIDNYEKMISYTI